MRRSVVSYCLILTVLSAALFVATSPSKAITYGFVDLDSSYSNVGAFIVKSPSSGQIFPICSGTLITPNVFLTASHCTSYFTRELEPDGWTAYASFDGSIPFGDLTSNTTQLAAVSDVVTNPNYNWRQSDSGDIGVLILDSNVQGITPAHLPACGLLDQLREQNGLKTAVFTPVGYGLQNRVVGGGIPYFQDVNPIPRMFAFSSFNSLNPGYLRLSQNPSTGNGGTCYGDSGGPNFFNVDGLELLAAVTITGDSVCRATNVDYRLDTSSAQAFFAYVNATYGTSIPIIC